MTGLRATGNRVIKDNVTIKGNRVNVTIVKYELPLHNKLWPPK